MDVKFLFLQLALAAMFSLLPLLSKTMVAGDSCCRWPWLQFADSVHTSTVWSTAKLLQVALAAVH